MKRLLFAVLMMTCSVSSAGWEVTGVSSDGKETFYHDRSTIRRVGELAKMWTMIDYSVAQIDNGDRYKSAKSLYAFNCKEETDALTSLVWYSASLGKGRVIYNLTIKDDKWEWNPVVPNTASKNFWKIACGEK